MTGLKVVRARETECEDTIVAAAKIAGWRVHAERTAQAHGKHMTPIKGHAGWVDLVLVRGGEALFVELKRKPNTVEPAQRAWHEALRAAGCDVRVVFVPEEQEAFINELLQPPPPSLPERIARKIGADPSGGDCWIWQGRPSGGGYGQFKTDGHHVAAHRVVYEHLVGPIPDGLELDHTCHTNDPTCTAGADCPHRRCVNPAHLEPVTSRENKLRGRTVNAINAAKTHCPKGHPLAGDNLYRKPDGKRVCVTCKREQDLARYYRRKHARVEAEVDRANARRQASYRKWNA